MKSAVTEPLSTITTDRIKLLATLDFSQMREKLMLPAPEGKGWTDEQARCAELWYRRFLHIGIKKPGNQLVPNGPIDAFWHQHILDTQRYQPDCESLFGEMKHHNPYYGIRGGEEAAARDADFVTTNEMFRSEFGEDCTSMETLFPSSNHGQGCNDAGSGTGCSQK